MTNLPAHGQSLTSTRIARSGELISSSLIQKALGHTCLALAGVPDAAPCSPALNHVLTDSDLRLSGLLASGYSNLKDITQIAGGTLSQKTIDKIFADDSFQLEAEANVALEFRSPKLSLRYSPLVAYGLIVARNEANPEVETRA
ncbi:hypothetical protein EB061_13490, partial [bacterium]|nr:hypothetical protein [bacterium]